MIEVNYYNSDIEEYDTYEVESIWQLLDHLDNAHLMMHIEGVGNLMSVDQVSAMKDLSRVIRELMGE